MLLDDIRQYLWQQNFAQTATNRSDICILQNREGLRGIFCVIIDSRTFQALGPQQIESINSQLKTTTSGGLTGGRNDVLFIVVTSDPGKDKYLAQIPGLDLWLADTSSGRLLIFENQPSDFYGLREGIEACTAQNAYSSGTGSNPRTGSPEPGAGRYDASGSRRSYPGQQPAGGKQTNRRGGGNVPVITISLIAVNIFYFLLTASRGNLNDPSYALSIGANYAPYVFKELQIWRLFTCMFIHFSLSHLAGNMFYLGVLGYQLERTLGHWRFLLYYLLSGLGASLVSACWYYTQGSYTVSAGASGAIYGLIGIMMYMMLRNRRRHSRRSITTRFIFAFIFVIYSSLSGTGVDGAAHIGGFIFGLLIGLIFIGRKKT